MDIEIQYCKMKMSWSYVATQGEYISHDWIVHLEMVKMVNLMLCGIFFTKIKKIKNATKPNRG